MVLLRVLLQFRLQVGIITDGLAIPEKVKAAISEYEQAGDVFDDFCAEALSPLEGSRLKTSELYEKYKLWAKTNGYKALCSQHFVAELRQRYETGCNGRVGNFVIGVGVRK